MHQNVVKSDSFYFLTYNCCGGHIELGGVICQNQGILVHTKVLVVSYSVSPQFLCVCLTKLTLNARRVKGVGVYLAKKKNISCVLYTIRSYK